MIREALHGGSSHEQVNPAKLRILAQYSLLLGLNLLIGRMQQQYGGDGSGVEAGEYVNYEIEKLWGADELSRGISIHDIDVISEELESFNQKNYTHFIRAVCEKYEGRAS